MPELSADSQAKQIQYRDARFLDQYNDVWQSVGKCVFCDLNEKYVFLEENGIVLTISLFAYIDGHFLIVPRRHVRSAKDLTQTEWETVRKFFYIAKKLVRDVHGIKGIQYVLRDGGIIAQSTVSDHLHIHCIPFDAPDLNQWNYRKLKHTPLENVALYKKARKEIVKSDYKFQQKHEHRSAFPVICDALIINIDDELLVQERVSELELVPNWLTLPGGRVDHFDVPFEEELIREVYEETGLQLQPKQCVLLQSQMGDVKRSHYAEALKVKYSQHQAFVWNTYIVRGVDTSSKLTAGDDARELVWIPLRDIATHERISPGVKALVAKATTYE